MKNLITTPKKIEFVNTSEYTHILASNNIKPHEYIIDMSATEYAHIAFVGFLIDSHQVISSKGGKLNIIVSKKIFKLLNRFNLVDLLNIKIKHVLL